MRGLRGARDPQSVPAFARTRDITLETWAHRAAIQAAMWETRNGRNAGDIGKDRLVDSGIGAIDVAAWRGRYPRQSPGLADGILFTEVQRLHSAHPDMSLRDAVGWVFAAGHLSPRRPVPLAAHLVAAWPEHLHPGGWLFAAAGWSAAEVPDPVDLDAVRAVAALRGALLPA